MAKTVHFGHFLLKIKFYCKIVPKSPFWHDVLIKIDRDAPFRSLMINQRILHRFIIKKWLKRCILVIFYKPFQPFRTILYDFFMKIHENEAV